jgi:hypothetical protein
MTTPASVTTATIVSIIINNIASASEQLLCSHPPSPLLLPLLPLS